MLFSHFPPSPSHTTHQLLRQFFLPKTKGTHSMCATMCAKSEQWRTLFSKQISNICPTSVSSDTGFIYHSFDFVAQIAKEGTWNCSSAPTVKRYCTIMRKTFVISNENLKETKVKKTQKNILKGRTNFWNSEKSFENDLIIIFLHH